MGPGGASAGWRTAGRATTAAGRLPGDPSGCLAGSECLVWTRCRRGRAWEAVAAPVVGVGAALFDIRLDTCSPLYRTAADPLECLWSSYHCGERPDGGHRGQEALEVPPADPRPLAPARTRCPSERWSSPPKFPYWDRMHLARLAEGLLLARRGPDGGGAVACSCSARCRLQGPPPNGLPRGSSRVGGDGLTLLVVRRAFWRPGGSERALDQRIWHLVLPNSRARLGARRTGRVGLFAAEGHF
ncbi:hypothetical protein DFJ74DRAFT_2097 [Hyaloraphidium curvatum]|nr:hypothetical protein DFJ74DRAFT_2097 [Hyaloraphidium curvatum]